MKLKSFTDWVKEQLSNESSAFTRSRWASFMGTGPKIPDASTHSRSTFPWNKKKKSTKKSTKKSDKKDDKED